MKIRPLHDFVLLRRAPAEDTSAGGIIIPDNAQERPQRGEVLAVGPGRVLENGARVPVDVEPGDVVYFPKHVRADAVASVAAEPDSPVLVRESELLAVLKRGPRAAEALDAEGTRS